MCCRVGEPFPGIRIKCRLECDVFCSVGELFNPESRCRGLNLQSLVQSF